MGSTPIAMAESCQMIVVANPTLGRAEHFQVSHPFDSASLLSFGPRQRHELTRITLGILEHLDVDQELLSGPGIIDPV